MPVRLDEVVATGRKYNGRQHERMAGINENRKSQQVFHFTGFTQNTGTSRR